MATLLRLLEQLQEDAERVRREQGSASYRPGRKIKQSVGVPFGGIAEHHVALGDNAPTLYEERIAFKL